MALEEFTCMMCGSTLVFSMKGGGGGGGDIDTCLHITSVSIAVSIF
eukprot:SAG22_NODE_1748_length_3664_cov_10.806171_3_plen_46_part_00